MLYKLYITQIKILHNQNKLYEYLKYFCNLLISKFKTENREHQNTNIYSFNKIFKVAICNSFQYNFKMFLNLQICYTDVHSPILPIINK